MKSCCKCGKSLLSGHILCSECKDNNELPLGYYIDQLAEEIVLEHPEAMCSLCVIRDCDRQQSGLTCRHHVKGFLVSKIETYAENQRTDPGPGEPTPPQTTQITDDGAFMYGDYHFIPYRKFFKDEIDRKAPNDSRPWKNDVQYAMRNMCTDTDVGISNYAWKKTDYSHEKFYAASGDSDADIFRCVENGKLYVPGKNELFHYMDNI